MQTVKARDARPAARTAPVAAPGAPARVWDVVRATGAGQPFTKASWESRNEPTVVELPNGVRIGGRDVVVMAGAPGDVALPLAESARALRAAGAAVFHAGTFAARRSPYDRTDAGAAFLDALDRIRATGMAVAAEAPDLESARLLAGHVDVLQVGPENMQNFPFLRQVARLGKPVMIVRGHAALLSELLLAAEYVLAEGNGDAILCEAGVFGLSFEERRLLDLSAVPVLQSLSHLPVVVAPWGLDGIAAAAMGRAATAAGADGVVLEARPRSMVELDVDAVAATVAQVGIVAAAMDRRLAVPHRRFT